MTRALCGSHQRCASRGPVGGAVTCPLLLLLKILVFVMYISPSPRSVHASHHQPAMNVAAVIGAPFIGRRSGETCPGRRAPGTVCPPSSRLVLAWGGGWEFDDDVWERLGTRILNFVLRRKEPEEPHPLRMQRWTISMRRFPFFRLVVRHMQFYVDGRCEVEEEVHSPPLFPKRRKKAGQSALPSAIRAGKGESAQSRKLRKRRPHVKKAKIAEEPPTLQGKWKYDKYGLNWELEEGGLRYFYHAELIWHSFGDRPKMHCGWELFPGWEMAQIHALCPSPREVRTIGSGTTEVRGRAVREDPGVQQVTVFDYAYLRQGRSLTLTFINVFFKEQKCCQAQSI
ncbi:hypothetical protein Naga_100299g3 [Nannochloropsis gaditana]|uniref:Uncharacterized protein n=1 Tax=Nannochloropsis gaditana TaxID=72520 RepID=W7TU45_9STRA|nr:hypothetical protein Naga_100299g3 [Nannochloropsis gaditana]